MMLESLAAYAPRALSVLRIITGLLIVQHGMGKILGFPAFPAYANVQPLSLIGAAGFIELIGGALLIVGLCTRPVAFVLAAVSPACASLADPAAVETNAKADIASPTDGDDQSGVIYRIMYTGSQK